MPIQVLQIRFESHWRSVEADVIRFAPSLVGQLREVKLAPIRLPVTVTEVTHAGCVNPEDNNTGSLRVVDCGAQIWILQIAAPVVAIDPVRYHQYLSPCRARRPAFDQIA